MHLLTGLSEEMIAAAIEKFAKTYYSYALASPMLYRKPTFHLREWVQRKKEESQCQS
jgi:hypothetical protein